MEKVYSIVENGVVVNCVVAAEPLGLNWHEGNFGIGAVHTASGFAIPPAPKQPIPRDTQIHTRLAAIDAETNKPRTLRELALNKPDTIAYVTALDDEAAALRAELLIL